MPILMQRLKKSRMTPPSFLIPRQRYAVTLASPPCKDRPLRLINEARWPLHLYQSLRLRWVEWVLSYAMIFFGVVVVGSPHLLPRGSVARVAFDVMSSTVSPMFWGCFAITLGLIRMAALYVNGRWSPTYFIRVGASVASSAIWFNILWAYALFWFTIGPTPMAALSQIPLLLETSVVIFASQERLAGKAGLGN